MFECLKDINTWLLYTTLHRDKFCAYLVFTPNTPKDQKYLKPIYQETKQIDADVTKLYNVSQFSPIPAVPHIYLQSIQDKRQAFTMILNSRQNYSLNRVTHGYLCCHRWLELPIVIRVRSFRYRSN